MGSHPKNAGIFGDPFFYPKKLALFGDPDLRP